jgi:ATP synthase protein I
MSTQKTNERDLMRGALIPTFAVGIVGIIAAALIRGKAGLLAALLAQLVVVMYFTVHLAVSAISRKLDPLTTFALAIFSYFAKIALLGLFLWLLTRFTSRQTIDRTSFAVVALALTVAWLGGEIRSFLKLQIHLPLPQANKNEEDK